MLSGTWRDSWSGQELDLMILMSPVQLSVFRDYNSSIIEYFSLFSWEWGEKTPKLLDQFYKSYSQEAKECFVLETFPH